jgi:outer membrane receptor protein involved in Fe transport
LGLVTCSLQIRAQFETRLTQSYDQSVMIEWCHRHLLSSGEMHKSVSTLGLAVRARFIGSILVLACTTGLTTAASLRGQDAPAPARSGRIVGRILDAATGQGLSDVGVQIVGTTLGASSTIDGRYTVANVPAGTVTIQVRRLGYAPKTVTGILLDAGQTLEQNVTMQTATVQLQAMQVTAANERGTVNEALDQQRTATGIVSSVTAEQIARSADSDAAQAVQRVSGVTVQDGRYVFVRGLGERYTTASLNGTRIPSPEPERRVVPLDLFPSGLLQSITTSKTFTPDQSGDFSGAQVDIRTREFPARRQVTYAVTTGYNSGATGSTILTAPRAGGERLALVGSKRDLPWLLASVGNFQQISLNQGDKNLLINTFRNSWSPLSEKVSPNVSTSVSVGGNDPVLGHRVGYVASATYSLTQDEKSSQMRALADRGSTPGATREINRFEGSTGSSSVLWGGLFNLSTLLGASTRVMLNNTYNRTADNDARSETGSLENEGVRAHIDRLQYVERSVRSNQLAAEHQLGSRHKLDWAATSSAVTRDEPDRSEFVSVLERGSPNAPEESLWLNTGNQGAVRTFSTLDESSAEGRLNYQMTFLWRTREHSLKFGGLYRGTDRTADSRSFSISAAGAPLSVRDLPPEQLFDGRFSQGASTVFDIAPLGQGGAYDARDRLSAGYAMTQIGITDRVRFIGGARLERDDVRVRAVSTLGAPVTTNKTWTDVLPSAAVNIKLTEGQSLRLSVSRTLARPEYRELSPIASRDVIGGDNIEGDPNLDRTRIDNADLRWEWYPNAGEVVSIAVFGKRFDKPIERVYRPVGSGSRTVFYLNADGADNYGVELELRKNMGAFVNSLEPLTAFTNVTVMGSRIRLGETTASATKPNRRMVGQAPYVVNAGLTYAPLRGSTSATLLVNRIGERIDAAGDQPLPDVIDQARTAVDFSLRFPLVSSLSGRFDAKNLLDDPYETVQGTVIRESYRAGRVFQLGLVWHP